MSRRNGVDETKLRGLANYETAQAFDVFDELERLCLTYADHMTTTPVSVSDELFAKLRLHLSDKQLVELTSTIAWENYRARFNYGLGIPSDHFSEATSCPIPTRLPKPSEVA